MTAFALALLLSASAVRPVNTYSIVAGELGVAVADRRWRELVRRLPDVEQLPKDPGCWRPCWRRSDGCPRRPATPPASNPARHGP